jgi:hypothetical protein
MFVYGNLDRVDFRANGNCDFNFTSILPQNEKNTRSVRHGNATAITTPLEGKVRNSSAELGRH